MNILTDDVVSELVLSDVVKQGGEHWQEGDGGVVYVLRDAFDLLWSNIMDNKSVKNLIG